MSYSEVDPDEARRAARDILSGAEYAEPQESLVERAVSWIFERLGDAIATLTGGGAGGAIGWVIVAVLGAGAVWLVVRALRVPAVRRVGEGDLVRYGTEAHRDASAWLREADRLSAAGDHRGALRCRYQGFLAGMVTEGLVDDVAGRTSGEYQAVLQARLPQHAGTVDDITRTFEDVWYGGAPAGAVELERFGAACLRIENEVRHSSVPSVRAGA